MTNLRGKVSWFGGPDDMGVAPDEGLAFIYDVSDAPQLFLDAQPPGTTGLARRLDPEEYYIATRWDYDIYPKSSLLDISVLVRNVKTGKALLATPADWGPNENTGRVADISPGLMEALALTTDDEVEVEFPYDEGVPAMPYSAIVISSGHSEKCRGASGILDEVDEATKVVDCVGEMLRDRGVNVTTYHDTISTSQNENLNRIVDFHNSKSRDLDVSVHFNAYVETDKSMGTEVLYCTQTALAADVSHAIAEAGNFIDRGAKKRTDLFFLNNTEMPSILIEVCFVDSTYDADYYREEFEGICCAIADVLGGAAEIPDVPDVPEPPARPHPTVRIDIEVTGDVTFIVNGVPVT